MQAMVDSLLDTLGLNELSWALISVVLFGVGQRARDFSGGDGGGMAYCTECSFCGPWAQPDLPTADLCLGPPWEMKQTVLLPSILAGVHLALDIGWFIIIPAEMFKTSSGLRDEILNTHDRLTYDEMFAVILVIDLLGIMLGALASRPLRQHRVR